ncbi:MAG: hypothetical protein KBC84_10375, partial [Proteobacteria bacterium]|nr:hypothetical protein [Pseudomonadota bacterium]
MPEIISSKVIFSESCNLALYSSNRSGRVRPYRLEISEQSKWQSYALGIENKESEDYFARDLSSDCSQVALVGDSNGNEHYRVYLFDIQNRTLTKISSDDVLDSGNPNFSPKGDLLAFTADRKLFVYNLAARKIIQEFSANYKILNFAWAQTNQRIFIQDEGGSIYSQDLITAKREELFVLPKKSYSSSFLKSYADRLYFISDHDSDFSQIYKLDLESKNVSRVLPEDADQSDPQLIGDKLYYKSSIAGKLCLKSISPGGPSTNVICDGVVYSYALFKDRLLALYSNYNSPTSIYQYSASGMLSEKLGLDKDKNLTPPIALGSEALPNFLFTPQSKTDSVVIWLHGGPYE